MDDFKEMLKNAICREDITFLEKNKNRYSVDDRLEDENNDTLLLYSLSDSESEVYSYFLKKNADVTLINDEGENVIHSIVYSGKIERLEKLLNSNNINHQSKDGSTPLLLSIGLEKVEMAIWLIKHGADINISDHEGNSPIHLACFIGNLRLVKELVEHGANLSQKTSKGNLPFAIAVNMEYHELVRFLYSTLYQSSQ